MSSLTRALGERLSLEVLEADQADELARSMAALPLEGGIGRTQDPYLSLHDLYTEARTTWTTLDARAQVDDALARLRPTVVLEDRRALGQALGLVASRVEGRDDVRAAARRVVLLDALRARHEPATGALTAMRAAEHDRLLAAVDAEITRLSHEHDVDARERATAANLAALESVSLAGPGGTAEAVRAAAARMREDYAEWRSKTRTSSIRLLELCVAGSLGFWVCVGLLAGWARRRQADPATGTASPHGKHP